jgi:hypothetical protein
MLGGGQRGIGGALHECLTLATLAIARRKRDARALLREEF